MVFHVLSIPTYPTLKDITISPFVQKVYKFCDQMTKRGHTVYHYGHPHSVVNCRHIDVVSLETYEKDYGINYFSFKNQDVTTNTHKEFNANAAREINNRAKETDFILAFWGFGHKDCCDNLKIGKIIEASIGYDSFFAENRVFESYAQLHKIIGSNMPKMTDIVIPPSFDVGHFYNNKKEDYLLYMGRMIDAKGIVLCQQIAQFLKTKIKFVGPQNMKNSLDKTCKYSEFIDTVGIEEKAELMSKTKCLLMPSLYVEPCGWVMIESFLSGTPVVSTDWGGMSEYNIQGLTGFRCRTVNEFVHAVKTSENLDYDYIQKYAQNNFNHNLIMEKYENYFSILTEDKNIVKNQCKFSANQNYY